MPLKIPGVGQPGFENKIRDLVPRLGLQDRVEFLGQVVGGEKQKLLAGARVTVVPSDCENFGMVVLESLAQNTPVIASTGTPWSSLETTRIGLWVENSPELLAQAIDRFISMGDEEYTGYRSRARKFVEERFAIEDNIGEWLSAYDMLMNNADDRDLGISDIDRRDVSVS